MRIIYNNFELYAAKSALGQKVKVMTSHKNFSIICFREMAQIDFCVLSFFLTYLERRTNLTCVSKEKLPVSKVTFKFSKSVQNGPWLLTVP